MAFDFPASPAIGTIYSPAGGLSYRWDGEKWQLVTDASLYQMKTALPLNLVKNPGFQISQQNADTASTVNGWYVADLWQKWHSLSTGVISAGRVLKTTPRGSLYRARATVTTAQAVLSSGHYVVFENIIEGIDWSKLMWGTASAKAAVVRLGLNFPAGTWTVSLTNPPATHTFVAAVVIPPELAGTDVEVSIPVPPGTLGVWATGEATGVYVDVAIAAGSGISGPAGWNAENLTGVTDQTNGMATNGSVFEVFDVAIHADPDGTGLAPEFQGANFEDDLLACQRYWKWQSMIINGWQVAGGAIYANLMLNPRMRGIPTVSVTGTPSYSNASNMVLSSAVDTNVQMKCTITATGFGWAVAYVILNARM